MRRALPVVLLVAVAVVAAVAAEGYVVILTNGSRLPAREVPEVRDGQAIITLLNGTVTSLPLEQIDRAATERYNRQGFGSALVLEGVGEQTPTPTPTPRPRLGDVTDLRRQPTPVPIRPQPDARATPSIQLREEPYPDRQVTEAFAQVFDQRKVYLFRCSRGTAADVLFVQAVTDSQQEVFHTLRTVSEAMVLIHQLQPERAPRLVELEMVSTGGQAAGTFRIGPEQARRLHGGGTTPEEFYVEHVIF